LQEIHVSVEETPTQRKQDTLEARNLFQGLVLHFFQQSFTENMHVK